ncbi:MAG: FtsW/RodA/SpoVE family cell cycle protein [Phycisphaeraceae bacterium]|nr:FtsW/RodA/SpoVE family cell cycle protein [Phycisphaeraceae bacterium]MCW5753617.1 FtsW/RodA/SpoVE family cell cycle protein [Phycisphaeraceae bacterium]
MLRAAVTTLIRGTQASSLTLRRSVRLVNPGWLSVLAAFGLSVIGVYGIDLARNPSGGGLGSIAQKQVIFITIGIAGGVIIAAPHYRWLVHLARPAMLVSVLLMIFLILPFVPESIVKPKNGTRGWINLQVADFQPSEVAKIAYVLVIARYLRYREEHRRFLGLVPLGLITFVPVGLILLQPDLGTACLFIPSLFAMLLAAGARLRHLAVIVLIGALAAPAAYPLLRPHQKARLIGLLKQVQDDRTSEDNLNYQAFRAQEVAGAGQWSGVSDAHARALIRYNRLPEGHNDMIFSVVVCRFGMVGGLGVIALSGVWVLGALGAAASCREPFGRLICVGLSAFVATQAVINIGMNLGVLPIIGITLPFVSYGGSSILSCWLMTALVFSVGLHRPVRPHRPSFEFEDDEAPAA